MTARLVYTAIFCMVAGMAFAQKAEFSEIVVRGGKTKAITIIPTADNEYAPLVWKDQKGNIVAMIVAHEKQTNGAVHNHLSIYTAGKDRSKRVSRIDVQFGTDDPIVSFEKINVMLKKDAKLLLPDEKGGVVQVYSENGVIKTRKTSYTTNLVSE